jgi:hypothetical protein
LEEATRDTRVEELQLELEVQEVQEVELEPDERLDNHLLHLEW